METYKLDKNNNTLWHLAVKNYKLDKFWINIIDKYDIEQLWNIKGHKDYTVWHLMVLYIKSDLFWEK